jgi:hypothetical protein
MRQSTVEFRSLRGDWYANGNFMARALQRQLRAKVPLATFTGFPRHWLPLFEWTQAPWRDSIDPPVHVPLVSGRTENQIVADISRARKAGQLRLLVEVVASAEIVLCETLQRIDGRLSIPESNNQNNNEVRLTTWHSYNRAEVRDFDSAITDFRQTKPGILFIPCAKARPYQNSQAHRRLMRVAHDAGLDVGRMDIVVITSIGPIPEPYWELEFVQRYDTGVRDIYRLLLQTRSLLKNTNYVEAWDLMSFAPYSDMLRLLHRDGYLPELKRLPTIRRRNIPLYRRPTKVAR